MAWSSKEPSSLNRCEVDTMFLNGRAQGELERPTGVRLGLRVLGIEV